MNNKLLRTRMVPIPRQMFLPYYLTVISSYWKEHTYHVSVAPTGLGSETMLVFLLWKEMHGQSSKIETRENLYRCLHREIDQADNVWHKAPSFFANFGDFILDPLSESGLLYCVFRMENIHICIMRNLARKSSY